MHALLSSPRLQMILLCLQRTGQRKVDSLGSQAPIFLFKTIHGFNSNPSSEITSVVTDTPVRPWVACVLGGGNALSHQSTK